jgi:hypothetical protein
MEGEVGEVKDKNYELVMKVKAGGLEVMRLKENLNCAKNTNTRLSKDFMEQKAGREVLAFENVEIKDALKEYETQLVVRDNQIRALRKEVEGRVGEVRELEDHGFRMKEDYNKILMFYESVKNGHEGLKSIFDDGKNTLGMPKPKVYAEYGSQDKKHCVVMGPIRPNNVGGQSYFSNNSVDRMDLGTQKK